MPPLRRGAFAALRGSFGCFARPSAARPRPLRRRFGFAELQLALPERRFARPSGPSAPWRPSAPSGPSAPSPCRERQLLLPERCAACPSAPWRPSAPSPLSAASAASPPSAALGAFDAERQLLLVERTFAAGGDGRGEPARPATGAGAARRLPGGLGRGLAGARHGRGGDRRHLVRDVVRIEVRGQPAVVARAGQRAATSTRCPRARCDGSSRCRGRLGLGGLPADDSARRACGLRQTRSASSRTTCCSSRLAPCHAQAAEDRLLQVRRRCMAVAVLVGGRRVRILEPGALEQPVELLRARRARDRERPS